MFELKVIWYLREKQHEAKFGLKIFGCLWVTPLKQNEHLRWEHTWYPDSYTDFLNTSLHAFNHPILSSQLIKVLAHLFLHSISLWLCLHCTQIWFVFLVWSRDFLKQQTRGILLVHCPQYNINIILILSDQLFKLGFFVSCSSNWMDLCYLCLSKNLNKAFESLYFLFHPLSYSH